MTRSIGKDIYDLAYKLWPINRSITGEGLRESLNIIKKDIPSLNIFEVESGTNVFDWVVPKEWSCKSAYILDPNGRRFCDFKKNNLHLVGYSSPINKKMSLSQLQDKLYSLPDQPSAIPYVTSYYKERWGFCISHEERKNLIDGEYQVVIESNLFDGVLNYGEVLIKGDSEEEIFLSSYVCHPSMANNELSGPSVLTYLTKWLLNQKKLKYSYRIIFIPETIGSVTYLSKHYKNMKKLTIAGFNISCVGDERAYSYLPSRHGDTLSDQVARHVLQWIDTDYIKYNWNDRGSDERQYCAPGIDLPIASICRSKYGEYPEYHTSLDNLDALVTPNGLEGGYNAIRKSIEAIEKNIYPKMTVLCEPQLGKRGLYPTLSKTSSSQNSKTMMDFITWSDGSNSLLEIAQKIDVPIWDIYEILDKLVEYKLVEVTDSPNI
tara:strand:- start:9135 stop:10436 length:1302 start_codon:yes stop_codon:yes gene_type:complete